MERLLKKVDKGSWMEFKAESARHGMRMGEFLGYLLEEHKTREKKGNVWDHILRRKKWITAEETGKMKKACGVFERIEDFE